MPTRRRFLHGLALTGGAGAPASASAPTTGEKLGIGLIGCGGRGAYLASVVQALAAEGEPAEIVAVCDIYRPRRERVAQKFSARAYARVSELVADPRVQGVIIATPDRAHVYNALEATRAGKDIYCEKPLTHWQQFEPLWACVMRPMAPWRTMSAARSQRGSETHCAPTWKMFLRARTSRTSSLSGSNCCQWVSGFSQ
jgi:hypothetical protein